MPRRREATLVFSGWRREGSSPFLPPFSSAPRALPLLAPALARGLENETRFALAARSKPKRRPKRKRARRRRKRMRQTPGTSPSEGGGCQTRSSERAGDILARSCLPPPPSPPPPPPPPPLLLVLLSLTPSPPLFSSPASLPLPLPLLNFGPGKAGSKGKNRDRPCQ